MKIGNHSIGPGHPLYFIAEIGVNHNGEIKLAKALIDKAVEAEADAVKFQSFDPNKLVTANAEMAEYQKINTKSTESQLDMLRKLVLASEEYGELKDYCREKEITFLSSPFDEDSLNELIELGVDAIKVPSGEITNTWMLEKIKDSGLPVILSTGMTYVGEIERAVQILNAGNLAILHCVSSYPTPPDQINLRAISTLRHLFKLPTGFSDHTEGIIMPIAAASIGADIIEKHFTLDKNMAGPDHRASLEPHELSNLIRAIRDIELGWGDGNIKVEDCEKNSRKIARKSLVLSGDFAKGTVITRSNVIAKRPGTGLSTSEFKYIEGRKLAVDLKKDTLLTLDHFI